jgi:glycosyltransferase involved in cell wall biosynthesis
VNIGIFTDNDFDKVNGVTTTLTAALRCAPAGMRLRIYTASTLPVVQDDYLALKSAGLPIPFYGEMRMYLPRLLSYVEHARADHLDVLHLTTPGPIGLAALFVAWKLGLPLVGSFHTDLAAYTATLSGSARLGSLMREYMRWPYGKCARVLVPSEHTRRMLIGSKSERWHVSDKRPALLYVGRVSREKGLGILPRVRDRLHALGVEHRLIIVGQGPMLPKLREQLPDAVFTGALSREAVAEAFASADLFVFPSRTDTAGNVVLEAQASGLPVVVAGEGGPRENMISGRTGLICYTEEADEWASGIASLLKRSDLRGMREAARQFGVSRRWERALEPLYRAYREVHAAREATAPPHVVPLATGPIRDVEL